MNTVLIFAYGSNLDDNQMRSRCTSARVEARAALPNHALAFGGFSRHWGGAVASVVPEPGTRLEGLLYRIARSDLLRLDRHEGTPFAYERISKLVTDQSGRRRRAQVYRQSAGNFDPSLPQPAYFRAVARVRAPGLRFRAARHRRGGVVVSARKATRIAPRASSARGAQPPARPRAAERRSLVFVYGTLLVGERNHRLLTGAQLICEAKTPPRFQLHDLGAYPGLVRRGKQAVAGEVYEVGEVVLAALDRLEDHPRFYRRTSIVLDDGRRVQTYLLRRDQVEGYPIIPSGSWRNRRSKAIP